MLLMEINKYLILESLMKKRLRGKRETLRMISSKRQNKSKFNRNIKKSKQKLKKIC